MYRQPLIIALQSPSVPSGGTRYVTSRLLPRGVTIDAITIQASAAAPSLEIKLGIAAGAVTDAASSAAGTSILGPYGIAQETGFRDRITLPTGEIVIEPVNLDLGQRQAHVFAELRNGGAEAVSASIVFVGHIDQDQGAEAE